MTTSLPSLKFYGTVCHSSVNCQEHISSTADYHLSTGIRLYTAYFIHLPRLTYDRHENPKMAYRVTDPDRKYKCRGRIDGLRRRTYVWIIVLVGNQTN